jgi:hypothetical protein
VPIRSSTTTNVSSSISDFPLPGYLEHLSTSQA